LGLFGLVQLPLAGWHIPALWHWSSGTHTTGFEPVQVPVWQVSIWVHRSESSQPLPSGLFGLVQLPVACWHMPALWHWSSGVQLTGFEPVHVPDWQVSVWVHRSASSQLAPSGLFGLVQLPVACWHVPTLWHWSSGVQTTGFEPVQMPVWQVSVWVHRFESSQFVPSGLFGFEQLPVPELQMPALWHWSSGVQTTGFEPVQMPVWQVSVWVHRSPSLQPVPSDLFGFVQLPVAGWQMPALWHWSSGTHTTGFEPVQVPVWQVSLWVHRSPSLQPVPSGLIGLVQLPVAGWQMPALWHWSSAVHTTGLEPVQVPDWQVSVWVHRLESLQLVPLGLFGLVQLPVAGWQTPTLWHWSSAVQTIGSAPVHVPAWQVSVWVHRSESSQGVPFGLGGFEQTPETGLQVPAAWHWSEAVQTTGLEPVQTPAWQVSVCVHILPSLQPVPLATGVLLQTPPEHTSVVQTLLSSQSPLTRHSMQSVSLMSKNVSQSLSQPSAQVGLPNGPSVAPGLTEIWLSSQSSPPGQASSR
jgi:hypothetical protein